MKSNSNTRRSRCPRRQRHMFAPLVAGIAVSIPAGEMDVYILCLYVVLFCIGRGLCEELIPLPNESYRVPNKYSDPPQQRGHRKMSIDVLTRKEGAILRRIIIFLRVLTVRLHM
jgi:hypothetical protein